MNRLYRARWSMAYLLLFIQTMRGIAKLENVKVNQKKDSLDYFFCEIIFLRLRKYRRSNRWRVNR